MAIVETDLTEAEVTELLVDVEELRRTTTNNLRAIREFRNDIREIKSLIFQVFGRQETPSTPNPPSSGVSSLHKPPIDTDRPIPNIAATHPPLLDNLATHLVIPVHQPPTKASKEVDDVPDMTDAELFSTGLVEVDSKPILKRVDAMPMSEVKVPINSIHICCISEPHESPQGSLEFRYDQIILILIKFVNTYFVRNKIFVDTGWNPVERGGMVAAGSSKAAESQNRSDMLADEKRLKLENKAVMLGARDVARDIMCSSFPILKKFCGTLNSNMGRSLICVRSDFKDEQIKIQRNINELMVDNLMEEDEIRELDDLDLEFNEISEDDEELDEYDMLTKVIDTYASLTRKGKDIQGIPWDRLNVMRDEYRTTRIDHYKNFENFPLAGEAVKEQCKRVSKDGNYFEFFHNSRMVKPILHFQLRNLIWATSKHDVYLMSNYSLMHWSSISSRLTEILNFSENITPNEKHFYNDRHSSLSSVALFGAVIHRFSIQNSLMVIVLVENGIQILGMAVVIIVIAAFMKVDTNLGLDDERAEDILCRASMGNYIAVKDTMIIMQKDNFLGTNDLGNEDIPGATEIVLLVMIGRDLNLAGQFGIGLYLVYLVVDYTEMIIKHNDNKQHVRDSKTDSRFTVFENTWNEPLERGTEISFLSKDGVEDYLEDRKLNECFGEELYSLLALECISLKVVRDSLNVKSEQNGIDVINKLEAAAFPWRKRFTKQINGSSPVRTSSSFLRDPASEIDNMEFTTSGQVDKLDRHVDSVTIVNLCNKIKEMVEAIRCPLKFMLKNLLKPDGERIGFFVRSIVNYCLLKNTKNGAAKIVQSPDKLQKPFKDMKLSLADVKSAERSVRIISPMLQYGFCMDEYSYVGGLMSYAITGELQAVKEMHGLIFQGDLDWSTYMMNALVDIFAHGYTYQHHRCKASPPLNLLQIWDGILSSDNCEAYKRSDDTVGVVSIVGLVMGEPKGQQIGREMDKMDARNKGEVNSRMLAAVASNQYGQEKIICTLIADACIHVWVAMLLGGRLHDSTIVRGIMLKNDAVGSIKKVENPKLAVFVSGIDTYATETKRTVLIHNAEQLENYAKNEETKVEVLIKVVADSSAKVIVSAVAGSSVELTKQLKVFSFKETGLNQYVIAKFAHNSYEGGSYQAIDPPSAVDTQVTFGTIAQPSSSPFNLPMAISSLRTRMVFAGEHCNRDIVYCLHFASLSSMWSLFIISLYFSISSRVRVKSFWVRVRRHPYV